MERFRRYMPLEPLQVLEKASLPKRNLLCCRKRTLVFRQSERNAARLAGAMHAQSAPVHAHIPQTKQPVGEELPALNTWLHTTVSCRESNGRAGQEPTERKSQIFLKERCVVTMCASSSRPGGEIFFAHSYLHRVACSALNKTMSC